MFEPDKFEWHQWRNDLLFKAFKYQGGTCINSAPCCGTGSVAELETFPNGDVGLHDLHNDNGGYALFTGYCSLACLLLDVWHAMDDDGTNIGDRIRALKKAAVVPEIAQPPHEAAQMRPTLTLKINNLKT